MATQITLSDIRDAADKKYGGLPIDLGDGNVVTLRNPIRLSKEERKALTDLTASKVTDKESKEDISEEDALAVYKGMIEVCADNKALATKLLETVGDDAGLLLTLIEQFSEGIDLGEASPSQD